jgi:hypothetical protein
MQNFLSVKVNVHWIGMASSGFHASIKSGSLPFFHGPYLVSIF